MLVTLFVKGDFKLKVTVKKTIKKIARKTRYYKNNDSFYYKNKERIKEKDLFFLIPSFSYICKQNIDFK